MDARVVQQQKFLPALADQLALWFPELNGRALSVSEVSVTKDNVPTLPLAMVAFIRSTANPPSHSSSEMFEIVDTFVVDFWLEPARYKKANGTETPFWSYYDYESIRDTLLSNMVRWETPGGERIAFRGMTIEAEPLAVTLTFTFMATFRWCSSAPKDLGEPFTVGFNLCTPNDVCIPDCLDDLCNPCEEAPIGTVPSPEEDLEEAPNDGKMYVRQSGQWVAMPVAELASVFHYRFDQNIGTTDPGAGRLHYNAVLPADVTMIYFDRMTQDDFDTTNIYTTMTFNDQIIIQAKALAIRHQTFRMLGPGVPLGGGDYFQVPVEFVEMSGAAFTGNLDISVLTRAA